MLRHLLLEFLDSQVGGGLVPEFFSVGFADCDAMALIEHKRVLSTARPRNRNFPHTCWMNFFVLASTNGDVAACFAYCTLAPYMIGAHG